MAPSDLSTASEDASFGGRPPSWSKTLIWTARRSLAMAAAVFATYLGGCLVAVIIYSVTFPPVTGVQLQRRFDAVLAGTRAEYRYDPIPLSQLDSDLPLAVVAGEDSRFFQHGGIDWKEINKSIDAYKKGDELRGASTITQQLVKNLFMTTHSTYLRKALEVPLTYWIELLLSKRRILELYVNVIEWGPGVYGAKAAAQHHYGTSVEHLTRGQAAALAACIPAPLHRRPETTGWYQRIILQRMNVLDPLPIS